MISLISAVASNNVIGLKSSLPWNIPEDSKYFMDKIKNSIVIIGRKTYEVSKEYLQDTKNIYVVTRGVYTSDEAKVKVYNDVYGVIQSIPVDEEAFVIGGAEIYRLTIDLADKLYITRIHKDFEGDAFFPQINSAEWMISSQKDSMDELSGLTFSFIEYTKQKPNND